MNVSVLKGRSGWHNTTPTVHPLCHLNTLTSYKKFGEHFFPGFWFASFSREMLKGNISETHGVLLPLVWGRNWYSSFPPSIIHSYSTPFTLTSYLCWSRWLMWCRDSSSMSSLTPGLPFASQLLSLNKTVQGFSKRCLTGLPGCQIYYSLFSSYISSPNSYQKGSRY